MLEGAAVSVEGAIVEDEDRLLDELAHDFINWD